jgi:hypothetical protein
MENKIKASSFKQQAAAKMYMYERKNLCILSVTEGESYESNKVYN